MTEEMDQRAAPEQAGEAPGEGSVEVTVTAAELAAVRELALKAHPDAVPELVGGATVAEVMASLEPARVAYRRVAEVAPRRQKRVPPRRGRWYRSRCRWCRPVTRRALRSTSRCCRRRRSGGGWRTESAVGRGQTADGREQGGSRITA